MIVSDDVFETVVVPRRSRRVLRVAPYLVLWLWPAWRRFGMRVRAGWRREDFLGKFAPFLLVLMLVTWVLALIFGFGLILHALQDQIQPRLTNYETAFYVAGTSLFTIGFGDFVPVAAASRFAVLLAGAAGLAVVALVIALTFNLYASFARREVLVLLLGARAGAPPSGVMLLETFGQRRIIDELATTFAKFEVWTAEMLDSHLAYPILPFFRSSHDGQSWVSTLGAVLDAATLLIAVVQEDTDQCHTAFHKNHASAEMMYATGCHALIDLTQTGQSLLPITRSNQNPGIERGEFEVACRQLTEAGYDAVCSDDTWSAFAQRRALYAERLNALARYFSSPPTQWIGDRTLLNLRNMHPHFDD